MPFNLIEPLFTFSKLMVLKMVVLPIPEGPKRHITSPSFSIEKETFFTLVFPPTLKSTFLISKKFYSFLSLKIYLDVTIIKEVAIKIKNNDGTAVALINPLMRICRLW